MVVTSFEDLWKKGYSKKKELAKYTMIIVVDIVDKDFGLFSLALG